MDIYRNILTVMEANWLILLFIVTFTVFNGFFADVFADTPKITRVVDGDTVEFEAKWLPSELGNTLKLRIWGIDTPEKGWRGKCEYEKELGQKASDFVSDLVYNGKKFEIILKKWGKFGGRVLGDFYVDGVSVRELLLENGLAREYYGDRKVSWCGENENDIL